MSYNCGVTQRVNAVPPLATTPRKEGIVDKTQSIFIRQSRTAVCRRYERTKKGFLVRLYRNMQSRISGIQRRKFHLYAGKDLVAREDFYAWALASQEYHSLFEEWERSGHQRRLSPSVDRKDSDLGYELANMQWLTHSQNSIKAGYYSGVIRRRTAKHPPRRKRA